MLIIPLADHSNNLRYPCEQRQTQHTVRLIKDDFEKLQQFLQEEEASMLTALKEEEEQKSRRIKDKIDRLTEEITSLTETINTTEEAIDFKDFEFLKVKMMRCDVNLHYSIQDLDKQLSSKC